MSKLKELYEAKQLFAQRVEVREAEILAELGDAARLVEELADLKEEKKLLMAEMDVKILRKTNELNRTGKPMTKSAQKLYVQSRIRDERRELNKAFEDEVVREVRSGKTPAEVANEAGMKYPTLVYPILKKEPTTEFQSSLAKASAKAENGQKFLYVDNRGAHRYAFSDDFSVLKYHGDESVVFMTWPEKTFLSWDIELMPDVVDKRANNALDILKGEYDGPEFNSPNPYKESE